MRRALSRTARTAVVLSDTHLRQDRPDRWLPGPVLEFLLDADVILHAGDVVDQGILDRLGEFGPVHAVLGNNDIALAGRLPDTAVVELAGVKVGMVHDSGPARGRAGRLHRRFPDCPVVVFGHSHIPVNEPGDDGQLLFNPGSPTQRRRQPHPTFGILRFDSGRIIDHRIIAVG